VAQATTTVPAAPVAIAVTSTPTMSAVNGPGLWQNIEGGFSSIFRSIADIFSGPSNYAIKPQSN
jgi:hypothetical protein